MSYLNVLKQNWFGMSIAVGIGVVAVLIKIVTRLPILDPLLVAFVIGIAIRSLTKFDDKAISGFKLTPMLFIPIGAVLYGAVNLNFAKFAQIDTNYIFMFFIVFVVYIISALLLSSLFGLNEKTGYLIAVGSAICGASAIAITSKAIDAEPDDVSVSLLSVFAAALVGLFIVVPLSASYFKISGIDWGFFSGTVLQFTGFVKASCAQLSSEAKNIGLSVKAIRYIGLLFLIPLLGSFVKGEFYIPWYLWAFFVSGLMFTFVPYLPKLLNPIFKPTLTLLWSTAMGAIGLNASLKNLFTKNGLKAFIVSLFSFIIAVAVFLIGIKHI